MDNVAGPWGHQLRWPAFSVRVAEADAERLPEILLSIPPERYARMRRAAAAVWTRFAWLRHPAIGRLARRQMEENVRAVAELRPWLEPFEQQRARWLRPLARGDWRRDAFSTLMAWLHHKMLQRGGGGGGGGGNDSVSPGLQQAPGGQAQRTPAAPGQAPPEAEAGGQQRRRRRRRRSGPDAAAATSGGDPPPDGPAGEV